MVSRADPEGGPGQNKKEADAQIPYEAIIFEKDPVLRNKSSQITIVVKKNDEQNGKGSNKIQREIPGDLGAQIETPLNNFSSGAFFPRIF